MSGRDPEDEPPVPKAGGPEVPPSDARESVSPGALCGPNFGGPLREIYLIWFENPDARSAVDWLAQTLEVSVRVFGTPDAGLRRRVRVIAAELDALGIFLLGSVDTRERTELVTPDWELARLAHHAGTALAIWADSLRAEIGDPAAESREIKADPDLGVRETALWPAEEASFATEMREVCRILLSFNSEIGLPAARSAFPAIPSKETESPTRRDVRATAQDLLHLADFTTATTTDLPPDDPLCGPLEALSYRLAHMVEILCAGFEVPS